MSEKRGQTEKLVYDFNSAACLEVQLPNEKWYRITPREFRSYTYPRRILVDGEYQTYEGPVYLYGTNIRIKNPDKKGLLYPNDIDPRTLIKSTKQHGRL